MNVMNLDQIRDDLNSSKGRWPRICDDTGLTYSWLQKFADGRIRNPGYERILKLAARLAEEQRTAA